MKTIFVTALAALGTLVSVAAADEKAPAFSVTEVRPTEGPVRGGLPMAIYTTPITGENRLVVFFGDEPVVASPCDAARQCWSLVSPPHAAGVVDVRAVADDQSSTVEDGFEFIAGPVIFTVTPSFAGAAGGNVITAQGFGFLEPVVTVDGVELNYSSTIGSIAFQAPPHPVGDATVTITNLDGLSTSFILTYQPLAITSVSPTTISGYEPVIRISGTGFSGAMEFYIGNVKDEGETLHQHGTFNAYFPLVPPGLYDVTAVDGAGSTFTVPDAITITAPGPVIHDYSPREGDENAGAYVTFRGDDFGFPGNDIKVFFGGEQAQFVRFANWSRDLQELSVIAPPHEVGLVDIVIENPSGAQTVIVNGFTYTGGPDLYYPAELLVNDVIEADSTFAEREPVLPFPKCFPGYRAHTYLMRPLESGLLTLTLCADEMYGAIMVRGQGESETFACQYEYCLDGAPGGPAVLELELEPCNPYEVYVVSQNLNGGPYTLESSFTPDGVVPWSPPVNDEPDGALPLDLSTELTWTEADFSCATASADAPDGGFPLVDLWYAASINAAGVLYANGGSCDPPFFGLYKSDLEPVAMDYQLECGGDPVPLPVPGAGDYLLRVSQLARWQFGSFQTAFEAYGELEGEGGEEGEVTVVHTGRVFEVGAEGQPNFAILYDHQPGNLLDVTLDGVHTNSFISIAADTQITLHFSLPPHAPGDVELRVIWSLDGLARILEMVYTIRYLDDTAEGEGMPEGNPEGQFEGEGEPAVEGAEDGEGATPEGEDLPAVHSADVDEDETFSLSEVLRVVQLHNAGAHHCNSAGEDGYRLGTGTHNCVRHSADFIERDWYISLEEVLRVVQLYNAGGYERCDAGEDGYCIKVG